MAKGFGGDFSAGIDDMIGGYGLAVLLFVFVAFMVLALIPANPVATPTAAASQVRGLIDRAA